ncbi:probable UDP-sugar transporter protein SLC35A4 isoform X1 [Sycon ciliatum]|uniref:probable UDP-sugar transporter protein SLC35A4 isoform X1 n=2 Tax=Sycon ciliatum TaxID=27933 RepID=UPI0031F6DDB5
MKSRALWILVAAISTLLYGGHPVLLKLSAVDGKIRYHPSAIVLCAELGKLAISLILLWLEDVALWPRSGSVLQPTSSSASPVRLHTFSVMTLVKCCVPAALYTLNNNIAVHSQHWLDPVSIQVLGNLKIVATVVVYKLMLHRHIGKQKLLAIGCILVAGVLNGLAGRYAGNATGEDEALVTVRVTMVGVCMMLVLSVSSAIAAVFTEKLLKHEKGGIHFLNVCLYGSGVMMNSATVAMELAGEETQLEGGVHALLASVVKGFTPICWFIVLCQVASGLLMSVVLKYAGNLLRLMIIACAVLVNVLASVLIFSLHIPQLLLFALPILVLGLALYTADRKPS